MSEGVESSMKRLRYPEVAPEGYAALQAFGHYVNVGTALEPHLLGMVYLRASLLNGCEFCTEAHRAELRKHHEPDGRIDAVGDWVGSEVFTPREQAALRWTDLITKLSGGPAPDEEYVAVSRFFQGKDLVDLTFAIANINAWNRMGVAFKPEWRARKAGGVGEATETAAALNHGSEARPSDGSRAGDGAPRSVVEKEVGSVAAAPAPASGAADGDDDGGKVETD